MINGYVLMANTMMITTGLILLGWIIYYLIGRK
jgi:hypothetical protein